MGSNKIQVLEKQLEVNTEKLNISMKWLDLTLKNKSIIQPLRSREIQRIIIYGASEFALRLLEVAKKENFEIIGISDKRVVSIGNEYAGISLRMLDELLEIGQRDEWIVITAVGFDDEIKKELNSKGFYNLIFLKDLVWDTYGC